MRYSKDLSASSSSLTFPDSFALHYSIPATFPQPAKSSSASVTTLPSGLTVVSETASSTTTVTLTYPKAGSSNESIDEAGAALANKCLAFKSGSGLSSALIMRNFEDDGALPFATSGRTSATVGFTSAPDMAVRLVPLLATNCAFEKWDVKDAITAAAAETADATSSSQVGLSFSGVIKCFPLFFVVLSISGSAR